MFVTNSVDGGILPPKKRWYLKRIIDVFGGWNADDLYSNCAVKDPVSIVCQLSPPATPHLVAWDTVRSEENLICLISESNKSFLFSMIGNQLVFINPGSGTWFFSLSYNFLQETYLPNLGIPLKPLWQVANVCKFCIPVLGFCSNFLVICLDVVWNGS